MSWFTSIFTATYRYAFQLLQLPQGAVTLGKTLEFTVDFPNPQLPYLVNFPNPQNAFVVDFPNPQTAFQVDFPDTSEEAT